MKANRAGHQPRPIFFPHAGLLLGLAAAGAVFLCYTTTLAPGLTWTNDGADGGDLITAAATLGVAHPTGYPTYLLLAHLFQYLPIGDLAFRTNLLSAAAALLAAACVYGIVHNLDGAATWRSSAAGTIAALSLGLAPVFWS